MNVWRVRYASEAIDGTPIEVSGVVVAPSEPLSHGSRDVVAYAHGTTGLFDPCAPSNTLVSEFFRDVTSHLVDAGYVVAATDYEGLGTPGIHPYHIGESEGRGVLDIIRAAAQIEEARAGTRAVVWGESQGGHAALFGGEIAPNWAPEIELLGVISAAPFSEIDTVFEERLGDPIVRGISWQLTLAYEATYPELSLEDVCDAETLLAIRQLAEQEACNLAFLNAAWNVENAGFVTNPAELTSWRDALLQNSPGYVSTEVPILLLQGSADTVIPQWTTDMLFDRLCEIGRQTDYRVFEGFDHADSLFRNVPTALEWTAARFAGQPASDACPN